MSAEDMSEISLYREQARILEDLKTEKYDSAIEWCKKMRTFCLGTAETEERKSLQLLDRFLPVLLVQQFLSGFFRENQDLFQHGNSNARLSIDGSCGGGGNVEVDSGSGRGRTTERQERDQLCKRHSTAMQNLEKGLKNFAKNVETSLNNPSSCATTTAFFMRQAFSLVLFLVEDISFRLAQKLREQGTSGDRDGDAVMQEQEDDSTRRARSRKSEKQSTADIHLPSPVIVRSLDHEEAKGIEETAKVQLQQDQVQDSTMQVESSTLLDEEHTEKPDSSVLRRAEAVWNRRIANANLDGEDYAFLTTAGSAAQSLNRDGASRSTSGNTRSYASVLAEDQKESKRKSSIKKTYLGGARTTGGGGGGSSSTSSSSTMLRGEGAGADGGQLQLSSLTIDCADVVSSSYKDESMGGVNDARSLRSTSVVSSTSTSSKNNGLFIEVPEQYKFLLDLACEIEPFFMRTFREVNGLPVRKQLFEAFLESGLLALKNGNASSTAQIAESGVVLNSDPHLLPHGGGGGSNTNTTGTGAGTTRTGSPSGNLRNNQESLSHIFTQLYNSSLGAGNNNTTGGGGGGGGGEPSSSLEGTIGGGGPGGGRGRYGITTTTMRRGGGGLRNHSSTSRSSSSPDVKSCSTAATRENQQQQDQDVDMTTTGRVATAEPRLVGPTGCPIDEGWLWTPFLKRRVPNCHSINSNFERAAASGVASHDKGSGGEDEGSCLQEDLRYEMKSGIIFTKGFLDARTIRATSAANALAAAGKMLKKKKQGWNKEEGRLLQLLEEVMLMDKGVDHNDQEQGPLPRAGQTGEGKNMRSDEDYHANAIAAKEDQDDFEMQIEEENLFADSSDQPPGEIEFAVFDHDEAQKFFGDGSQIILPIENFRRIYVT
ncbi:unnamed protein product [Amoebophrya sp. A25]|nr:unnamed protein product [Amoebophrya sp. A25]|eukprot:GSA25T00003540001.1